MNFDQFNEKSKLIINDAQNKAISLNHQQITNEHLVFSIMNGSDNFLDDILKFCKSNSRSSILSEIDIQLNKLPSVSGVNLNIFRPKIITIEIHVTKTEEIFKTKIYKTLKKYNYDLISQYYHTSFFKAHEFKITSI